jgi:hypothetical protein
MTDERNKKQRVNLFLDPEIVKKAKIQAVEENATLSQVVEIALKKYCSINVVKK